MTINFDGNLGRKKITRANIVNAMEYGKSLKGGVKTVSGKSYAWIGAVYFDQRLKSNDRKSTDFTNTMINLSTLGFDHETQFQEIPQNEWDKYKATLIVKVFVHDEKKGENK